MLAETDARCGGCGLCGGCGGGDGCAAGAVGVAGSGGGGRCERRWQGCRSRHRLPAGRTLGAMENGQWGPAPSPLSVHAYMAATHLCTGQWWVHPAGAPLHAHAVQFSSPRTRARCVRREHTVAQCSYSYGAAATAATAHGSWIPGSPAIRVKLRVRVRLRVRVGVGVSSRGRGQGQG